MATALLMNAATMLRSITQSRWSLLVTNVTTALILFVAIGCTNASSGSITTAHQQSIEQLRESPDNSEENDIVAADQHCCMHSGVATAISRYTFALDLSNGQPSDFSSGIPDELKPHIVLPPPKS